MTLLVAGYLTLDVTCLVSRIPDFDERITADAVTQAPGGMAANCACAAARLGSDVHFFGKAGTGELGNESIAALEAEGVDSRGVVRSDGGDSFCLIFVAPDGGRMIVSEPLDFDWRLFDEAVARGAEAFHVDGYRLHDARPRAEAARGRGIRSSIDLDGAEAPQWSDLEAAAAAFSILLLNRGVAEAVGRAPADAAAELVAAGADVVAVTLGPDGIVVAAVGEPATRIAGFAVHHVDTTGAGDVFAGAFLHRLLGGASPTDAAVFANAAAALSTTAISARGLLPTQEGVQHLLDSRPVIQEVQR
ncbi:MAG: carbohydrate kinase family protein [Gaiellaceae bacterium MAG52_C11]|nr:carbohydrate kinase family protein [Candidatus Gaiellasilicea maunaloa]